MAPEIALKQPYDKECDVFSFSMLLWEIASFQFMYPDYSIKDYYIKVCKGNERPPIPVSSWSWPAILKSIVTEGWDANPKKRPTMKRVGMLLRGLLQDICNDDDAISNRTQHMMNISRRSFHDGLRYSSDSTRRGGGGGAARARSSRVSSGAAGRRPSAALVRPSSRSRRSIHDGHESMD